MLRDGEKGVVLQRDKQTYAVVPHLPCGVVTPDILRKLADVAQRFGCFMKITSEARIALIGLTESQVDEVWAALGMDAGRVTGLCVRGVKACPGTTFCKRGMQDSMSVGMEMDRRYHGVELPGKMKFAVSGCPNQCAETAFKDIGLVGSSRGWKLLVGGSGAGRPRIGEKLADNLSTEQALALVDQLVEYFKANARPHERMARLIERIGGLDALKQALHLPIEQDPGGDE